MADSSNMGVANAPMVPDASVAKPKLSTLPQDILHQIWTHLEKPDSLARTNRFFCALSKDVFWQAKWFMERFEIYTVIYEAIARRKLFTPALFAQLRRLGAPLTVNLVQLLHVQFSPGARAHVEGETIDWGCISFAAYSAVMSEAAKLHGKTITFELERFDSYIFRGWMMEEDSNLKEDDTDPQPSLRVRRMFKEGFMPLPIALEESNHTESEIEMCLREEDVTGALMLDPGLLPLVLNHGYMLTPERISELVDLWLDQFHDIRTVMTLVGRLKFNCITNISKKYAKEVFSSVNYPIELGPAKRPRDSAFVVFDLERDTAKRNMRCAIGKRNLLVALDKANALPFHLFEIVKLVRHSASSDHHSAPSSPLRSKASSSQSKRARAENDKEDELYEVDNKGNRIDHKKARHG